MAVVVAIVAAMTTTEIVATVIVADVLLNDGRLTDSVISAVGNVIEEVGDITGIKAIENLGKSIDEHSKLLTQVVGAIAMAIVLTPLVDTYIMPAIDSAILPGLYDGMVGLGISTSVAGGIAVTASAMISSVITGLVMSTVSYVVNGNFHFEISLVGMLTAGTLRAVEYAGAAYSQMKADLYVKQYENFDKIYGKANTVDMSIYTDLVTKKQCLTTDISLISPEMLNTGQLDSQIDAAVENAVIMELAQKYPFGAIVDTLSKTVGAGSRVASLISISSEVRNRISEIEGLMQRFQLSTLNTTYGYLTSNPGVNGYLNNAIQAKLSELRMPDIGNMDDMAGSAAWNEKFGGGALFAPTATPDVGMAMLGYNDPSYDGSVDIGFIKSAVALDSGGSLYLRDMAGSTSFMNA